MATARSAGYDPGDPLAMSRRKGDGELLRWHLTPDTVAASGGPLPFLIDWGDSPHPTAGLVPQMRLESLTVVASTPEETRVRLDALEVAVDLELGSEAGLRCVLHGPRGPVTLA